MGSTLTMLVSTVESLATRLPTVTCSRLTRPSMGDLIWVNSRLSLAASTAACALATCATDWFWAVAAWSNSSFEETLVAWSDWARTKLRSLSSFCACACLSWPTAWSSAAWYGRGSMTKRRSSFLTMVPSLKGISVM